jgi:hypothetical protein
MSSRKPCLKYFEKPDVAELISSRLYDGLEFRLFHTILRNIRGSGDPIDPFVTMDREEDLLAAAREGRFGAVEWLFDCMNKAPKNGDTKVFARICASAASCGQLEILKWARHNGCPGDYRTCSEAAEYGHLECL